MTDAVESLGRIRRQGILLLVMVFLAGGLTGAALMRYRTPPPPPPMGPEMGGPPGPDGPGGPGGPPGLGPGRLPPMFDQLGLSDDQRVRIQAVFEGARPKSDSILGQALPAVRALMDSVRQEVRAILTEEQRKQFDQLERDRPAGPPPGGPPGPR